MNLSPGYEKQERKILDVFLKMNWEEQHLIAGMLLALARENYAQIKAAERTAHICQTSGKIIQLPACEGARR